MISPSDSNQAAQEDVAATVLADLILNDSSVSDEPFTADVEPLLFRVWDNVPCAQKAETENLQTEMNMLQSLQEKISFLEQRLEEQLVAQKMEAEQFFRMGREEGEAAKATEMEQRFGEEHEKVEIFLHNMEKAKGEYFQRVEKEVVRLALAIATRILHREAQLDPLLLAGVVHVAMEKMADTSSIVLKVAPDAVNQWQGLFRGMDGAQFCPTIIGDGKLDGSECILETQLGTVELGVKAQLEEIERGFFDLLQHNPQVGNELL
jgi:flagellar assembly protein FliH